MVDQETLCKKNKYCSSRKHQFRTRSVICHLVRFQNHLNLSDHSITPLFQMVLRFALRQTREVQLLLACMSVQAPEMRRFNLLVPRIFFRRCLQEVLVRCLRLISMEIWITWVPPGQLIRIESTPALACMFSKAILLRPFPCSATLFATRCWMRRNSSSLKLR